MTDGERVGVDRGHELAAGLAAVHDRIAAACARAGRDRRDIQLVAVSKTWPARDVRLLRGLGVRDFGENKDAEAAAKAAEVDGVRWHFVGQVQTNKARSVAAYADVVHALDRARLAQALSRGAQAAGRTLRVLVQVSLDGDPRRAGVRPGDVPALADLAVGLPGLVLGGVMAVAPRDADPEEAFARLAAVAADLRSTYPPATTISAGMSGDLEAAVGAGATLLRVGTALFGHRPPDLR